MVNEEKEVEDKYNRFKTQIKDVAKRFKELDQSLKIRLVSHLDADGISAASILIRLFNKENRRYSISIVQQLDKKIILELAKEENKVYMFSDLGSGQLKNINEILKDKQIFVLDHHDSDKVEGDNIYHVNPHLFGIDGGSEISGSGVSYLFAKEVNKEMEDMAHVAIIGAIGDIQENQGFKGLNNEILDTAIKKKKIEVKKGLKMFGAQTKPLHKVLEYSMDPYIPGVSGSESGAIQFLNKIGIKPREGSKWRKVVNLSDEEMDKLITSIVMQRANEKNPENILGNVYNLLDEQEESPTRDIKEFSTLLNACGRMSKASLGIGTCLGDKKIKQRAVKNLGNYRKEIVDAINWYYKNKDSSDVIRGKGYVIMNAKDNILSTIAGTMASILSKDNSFEDGTYILSMAQLDKGLTKASIRIVGREKNIDLREIIKDITDKLEGTEAGGHMFAAGALLPTEKEEEFIDVAKEVLAKRALEEEIV